MVKHALVRKRARKGLLSGAVDSDAPLRNHVLAMIFECPSTRTRISFDIAMSQLGGRALVLNSGELHLVRGESFADTAAVLSRYVEGIMIRALEHSTVMELARHASLPVINGLTDKSHPCQLIADIMTFEEHKGSIKGCKVAFLGEGNNMTTSWIHAAALWDFHLAIACPEQRPPCREALKWAKDKGAHVAVHRQPAEAVAKADCVVTDTWHSLGADGKKPSGHSHLIPYRVDSALMKLASPEAIFMHCLPAHRGEEVTHEVMDSAQSVVFDEAENRIHAQKAILLACLT